MPLKIRQTGFVHAEQQRKTSRRMRIGFDISQTGNNKAGCGYLADSLIQSLSPIDGENEYILYPHFGDSFWDPKAKTATRKINSPHISRKLIGRNFRELKAFWKDLPQDAEDRLGNPDIIHANNFFCPRGLKRTRIVYTLYDLSFFVHPEYTTEENRYVCFKGVFDAAVSADFIIAISRHTRDTFLTFFPHYPPERIQVMYLGSRFSAEPSLPINFKSEGIEPEKFWLAVGTVEPRKNIRILLSAFARLKENGQCLYPLIMAGGAGWLEDDLEKFIHRTGLNNTVHLLGYVPDETLAWLYENCFGFIYPSLYEGFGLPVLEAMGFGAAVITSETTSLPEVAGEAAVYINPMDVSHIAAGILKLTKDVALRGDLKKKAVSQARKFSWEKSAKQVLNIYEKVMSLPKFDP